FFLFTSLPVLVCSFNYTPYSDIYSLSLHDALPILKTHGLNVSIHEFLTVEAFWHRKNRFSQLRILLGKLLRVLHDIIEIGIVSNPVLLSLLLHRPLKLIDCLLFGIFLCFLIHRGKLTLELRLVDIGLIIIIVILFHSNGLLLSLCFNARQSLLKSLLRSLLFFQCFTQVGEVSFSIIILSWRLFHLLLNVFCHTKPWLKLMSIKHISIAD